MKIEKETLIKEIVDTHIRQFVEVLIVKERRFTLYDRCKYHR